MSHLQRVEGNRVYCHGCENEWDRAQGGLQCPSCGGEFVEIMEPNPAPRPDTPPSISPGPRSPPFHPHSHPFSDHNPWAADPHDNGFTTFEFNSGGGRGTFSFSSRTFTYGDSGSSRSGGGVGTSREIVPDDIGRSFEAMLDNILGTNVRRQPGTAGRFFDMTPNWNDRGIGMMNSSHRPEPTSTLFFGQGYRNPNQLPHPFELLSSIFGPANARRGDTVFSQEAFDRIMTQLMDQNSSNAPGPASDTAIAALKKKRVDETMLGSDGLAECSICMDNVEMGDEVTVLPCNHWFHGDCITSWLREHDTCPHCRQSTTNPKERNAPSSSTSRRRTSRRPSSLASPLGPREDNGMTAEFPFQDSSVGQHGAPQRFYSSQRMPEPNIEHRPSRSRRSSERSQRTGDNAGGSGGVTGWIRNRLPFSGQ